MNNLNIALVQMDSYWKDPLSNFDKIEKLLKNNKNFIDLVVLPEMFSTGFITEPKSIAEKMDGKTVQWMIKTAKENNFALMGSVVIEENNKYYNRLLFVNRYGDISFYDKKHLFTYGGEDKEYNSGTSQLIVDLNGWKLKPLVCYDLRFPVWAKNTYTKDSGYAYDVLIYIANWPSVRSFAFRQLLIARAIENQAYTIGVNRVGVDGKGLYYQGNSMALDFGGNQIIEIEPDTERLEMVSLSFTNLTKARSEFPVGNDWDLFSIES